GSRDRSIAPGSRAGDGNAARQGFMAVMLALLGSASARFGVQAKGRLAGIAGGAAPGSAMVQGLERAPSIHGCFLSKAIAWRKGVKRLLCAAETPGNPPSPRIA